MNKAFVTRCHTDDTQPRAAPTAGSSRLRSMSPTSPPDDSGDDDDDGSDGRTPSSESEQEDLRRAYQMSREADYLRDHIILPDGVLHVPVEFEQALGTYDPQSGLKHKDPRFFQIEDEDLRTPSTRAEYTEFFRSVPPEVAKKYFRRGAVPHPEDWSFLQKNGVLHIKLLRNFLFDFYRTALPLTVFMAYVPDDLVLVNFYHEVLDVQGIENFTLTPLIPHDFRVNRATMIENMEMEEDERRVDEHEFPRVLKVYYGVEQGENRRHWRWVELRSASEASSLLTIPDDDLEVDQRVPLVDFVVYEVYEVTNLPRNQGWHTMRRTTSRRLEQRIAMGSARVGDLLYLKKGHSVYQFKTAWLPALVGYLTGMKKMWKRTVQEAQNMRTALNTLSEQVDEHAALSEARAASAEEQLAVVTEQAQSHSLTEGASVEIPGLGRMSFEEVFEFVRRRNETLEPQQHLQEGDSELSGAAGRGPMVLNGGSSSSSSSSSSNPTAGVQVKALDFASALQRQGKSRFPPAGASRMCLNEDQVDRLLNGDFNQKMPAAEAPPSGGAVENDSDSMSSYSVHSGMTTSMVTATKIPLNQRSRREVAAFMAIAEEKMDTGEPGKDDNDIITIDSAATVSIECDLRHVVNYMENYNPNTYVEGLGGSKWRVSHVGVMPGTGRYMVVPDATTALLSVTELLSCGHAVTFCVVGMGNRQEKVAIITNSAGIKVTGRLNEFNHYVIDRTQLMLLQESGDVPANAEHWSALACKASLSADGDGKNKEPTPEEEKLVAEGVAARAARNQAKKEKKQKIREALAQAERRSDAVPAGITKSSGHVVGEKHQREESPPQPNKAPGSVALGLTAAEQSRVTKVTMLHNMYHCSDDVLYRAIVSDVFTDHNITVSDIKLWQRHHQCLVCTFGKNVRKSYRHNSCNKPAEAVGEVVHCDILAMYEKSSSNTPHTHFLICVDEVSSFLSFYEIGTKHKTSLMSTFTVLQAEYQRYDHRIKVIQTDSEVNFKSCNTELGLRGIELRCTPPHQHAQRIERYVRTVKDRVRIAKESLDYALPVRLYGELIQSIVSAYNDLPNSRLKDKSPRMLVQGKRTEINKRVMIPFGTVAIANCAGKGQPTSESRGEFGIVLGPSLLTYGAARFYLFTEGLIVDRNQFTVLSRNNYPECFNWTRREAYTRDMSDEFNIFQYENSEWGGLLTQADSSGVLTTDSVRESVREGVSVETSSEAANHSGRDAQHHTPATSNAVEAPRVPPREGEMRSRDLQESHSETAKVENTVRTQSKGVSVPENHDTRQEAGRNVREVRGGLPMVAGVKRKASVNSMNGDNDTSHDSSDRVQVQRTADSVDVKASKGVERSSGSSRGAKKRQDKLQLVMALDSMNADTPEEPSIASSVDENSNEVVGENRYFMRKRSDKSWTRAYINSVHDDRDIFVRSDSWKLIKAWQNGTSRRVAYIAKCYRLTVKQSMAGEHAQETGEAVREEIMNMIDYKVGHYIKFVDIPHDKRCNIVHSFMFVKHKEKPDGSYDRTKARVVANGKLQKDHMYDLVSSSTVALSSVLMLINIASFYKAELVSYDVKGAFLNAEFGPDDVVTYLKINREVTAEWVKVDPSALPYVDERGELLLQLDKFIYGLKQAPLKFQQNLKAFLLSQGYVQCQNDECLYVKHTKGTWSILSTHVDDILQVTPSKELVDDLHTGLLKKYKSITFHPNAESYIGMTIERSPDKSLIRLTQCGLLDKIVSQHSKDVNMVKTNTPCSDYIFVHTKSTKQEVDKRKYLSLVMSLMFLARLTRPATFC